MLRPVFYEIANENTGDKLIFKNWRITHKSKKRTAYYIHPDPEIGENIRREFVDIQQEVRELVYGKDKISLFKEFDVNKILILLLCSINDQKNIVEVELTDPVQILINGRKVTKEDIYHILKEKLAYYPI